MTKNFDVYCDVYGVNLHVIVGMSSERVKPYLLRKFKIKKWEYSDLTEPRAGFILDFDEWPYHVLWLENFKKNPVSVAKISHEVFHHVLRVCESKQVPTIPDVGGHIVDEAAAYLMEFYMKTILEKL